MVCGAMKGAWRYAQAQPRGVLLYGLGVITVLGAGQAAAQYAAERIPAAMVPDTEINQGASLAGTRPHAAGFYVPSSQQTYFTYPGQDMRLVVRRYDHQTQQYDALAMLDRVPPRFGKPNDFHNYPTLLRDAQGHINVIASDHGQRLVHYRSLVADAIDSGWEGGGPETSPYLEAADATYPLPVLADNGDVYVFYRHGNLNEPNDQHDLSFVKRRYDGSGYTPWSDPRSVVAFALEDGRNTLYASEAVHQSATPHASERIHLTWTRAGRNADGSGYYDSTHEDLFYAYFDVQRGEMFAVDGTPLGECVEGAEALVSPVCVEDTPPPLKGQKPIRYRVLTRYTDDGRPVLVYRIQSGEGAHRMRVTRWEQGAWQSMDFADHPPIAGLATAIMGDMTKIGDQAFRLFLSSKQGLHVLETTDGGASFEPIQVVQTGQPLVNVIAIEEADSGFELLGMTRNGEPWQNTSSSFEGRYEIYRVARPTN